MPNDTYWYKFYEYECPVCGGGHTHKERQSNTPKPDKWEERHIWIQHYDYCLERCSSY